MKLLVTRPEPGASATATRLRHLGHNVTLLPCLTITPITAHLPPNPAALIITSGHAIPALPAHYHQTPVFCVGDATAAKLRLAGFSRVESANGDAQALTRLVITRNIPGLHLLATGERLGLSLAAALRLAGIQVLRRKVYKVSKLSVLPEAMHAALDSGYFDGVMFYSAETARAFLRLNPPGTQRLHAYALSPTIEKRLQELPWNTIHIASAPTEADLMALLA